MRPPTRATAALALASLTWLAGCASPPSRPAAVAHGDHAAVRQHLDALIADEMRRHDVTGLSLALVDDQQVLWAFGAGWADAQAQRPADAHTVYRMGSIAKLLTDTAALQLVQRGQLDLDAPIQAALPDFRIRSRFSPSPPLPPLPITARQLMTHHAGLPRDVGAGMWGDAPPPFQQMVSGLADEDAPYPPGQHFDYSNVGVTVLGAAIERISGTGFEALMQQRLLDPLGMTGASFSSAMPAIEPMSKAYRQGRPVPEPALRDVPAGGLNASVLDLAQFIKMVFAEGRTGERTLLDAALLREMLRPQNADLPLDAGFQVGLGWMLSTLGGEPLEGGGPVAHHGGATVNFRSQMVLLPEHRLGVIVAANSASAGPVVNKLAQRALALALEAKTGIRQSEPEPAPMPAPAAWPEAELDALVGDYTTAAGFVRVTRQGSRLQAEAGGRRVQLLPSADGELRLRYKLLGLLPISLGELDRVALRLRRVAGRDLLLARIGSQTLRVGERLPPVAPAPTLPPTLAPTLTATLAAFAGTYVPETAPGEYAVVTQVRVQVEHGRLLARMTMRDEPESPVQLVLQPLSDHAAMVLGTLADGGEIIRLERDGDAPTFRGSGYRWRRVECRSACVEGAPR